MTDSPIRERCRSGHAAYTGWLSMPDPWSAEVMARAGFDALVVDLQHGLGDMGGLLGMLQAIGGAGVPALVRTAWNEPSGLMRALDTGAHGVICPMVNTAEECEAFVAACRYPPRGIRSFGPTRSLVSIGPDYLARAGAFSLTFAQIETAAGLDNVEAIARVEGLDGLYVGPYDLSLDLGLAEPGNLDDPRLLEACGRVLEIADRHQLIPGIYTNSAEAGVRMATLGFRLVNIATDSTLLQCGAVSSLLRMRELTHS